MGGIKILFKNLCLENAKESVDIRVLDGKFKKISQKLSALEGEEIIDCHGKLALPPLIESHVHLDHCLTAGNPRWNLSGNLFEGIEIWSSLKPYVTKADVKKRASKILRMQAQKGVQYVRAHLDTTSPTLVAFEALFELREELKDFITIQIVAFPQDGILSVPNGKQIMEDVIKMGADVVGAIPHYEFTREYSVESLNFAVKLAEKYDKLVDVHCDEIDDEAARGLETLATRAYESGMKGRVTASHTTAMHSYNNAYTVKLFRLLAMSDINFVSQPLINIVLQGRMDTYPKRRGVTRVKELLANGNNVSLGHDDIIDPFYPLGTGNMIDVVHMGLHVCQMMGYDEILNSYKLVTTNAAKTLNLGSDYGIKEGNSASFIILDAPNFYNALNEHAQVLSSYRCGKLVASNTPNQAKVYF